MQVRLQNRTGRRVTDGEIVRIFPGTTDGFIVAKLTEFGIIGTVSGTIDVGQIGYINLINTVNYSKLTGIPTTFPPTTHRHNYTDLDNVPVYPDVDNFLLLSVVATAYHYTGFPNRTDTTLSFVAGALGVTRTLTLGGANFKVYISGVEYTISGDMTKQIPDVTGTYWFWITAPGGIPQLNGSSDIPGNGYNGARAGFDQCLVATVYWNTTTDKAIVSDERHWMGRDKWYHEYLHQTIGARYYTGGALTFPTANTFSITQTEFYDEDIQHILALATTCKIMYKNGTANWEWNDNQTYLAKINGATIRYNNGNALADVSNSNHAAMWLFATNNTAYPFVIIIGQRQDVTLANARLNNTPDSLSYGAMPSAEMKLLFRIIFKQGTTVPIETADYRSVSNVPVINYTATDHSTLSKLGFAESGHTGFEPESKTTIIVTDTYTILTTDSIVVCDKPTPFTVTLPAAVVGRVFNIKNIGAGAVTLEGDGADTIDGVANQSILQWDSFTVHCYIANKWGII